MTRIGVVPRQSNVSVHAFTEQAQAALAAGADGIFAYDHLLTPAYGHDTALLPWTVALGAVRGRLGSIPVGPLVARCGAGNDPHIIQALHGLATGGDVVANLGIGDRNGRREYSSAGLRWPSREERIKDLVTTAKLCQEQGWPTFVASAKKDIIDALPPQVGVHTEFRDLSETLALSAMRKVGVSLWGADDEIEAAHMARDFGWEWLILTHKRDDPEDVFLERITSVRKVLAHDV